MGSPFTIKVDVAALVGEIDRTIVHRSDAALRPAAQAMAQVVYDEVKRNVGKLRRRTGNLASSIYQAYSENNSQPGLTATYHISWNAKKAPHGHLVEYGHMQRYLVTYDKTTRQFITHRDKPLAQPRQVAAKPFIRPAVVKFAAAQDAGEAEFLRRMAMDA